MFGWEFPPFSYGGLGTACQGIVQGLHHHDVHITLVLPQGENIETKKLNIVHAGSFKAQTKKSHKELLKILKQYSSLTPYSTPESYLETLEKRYQRDIPNESEQQESPSMPYGKDLFTEIHRYAGKAYDIARKHPHHLIHSHDWLTAPAGIMAKKASDQPLITHVHATEFDRTGDNPNQEVYDMERKGMQESDHIIAVSEFTKQKIIQHYGITSDKISVVHNAVLQERAYFEMNPHIEKQDHIILFLGRITLQKGPEYFLHMAKRVLEFQPNTKFVMAGNGDMMHRMIELSAQLGIARNVLFAGYLKGEEIDRAYTKADLYVMPSVSEPFGITPLEAIRNGTPVLISKQSGVSEVIRNVLRVDFWDIEEMANKVLGVIKYSPLHRTLAKESQKELHHLSWQKQSGLIKRVYEQVGS